MIRSTVGFAAVALVVSGCASLAPPTSPTLSATPGGGVLATLTVSPEDTGAHYSRDEWGDWSTVGGCDTRERVLKRDGTGVQTGAGCRVTAGVWVSPYDGVTVTDPAKLDIDHIVPLSEAQQSGARDWTAVQRSALYNDLDNLVAVTAKTNRSKGDQDPATWLPVDSYRCRYVSAFVAVKAKYRLSVDPVEHDALAAVLRAC